MSEFCFSFLENQFRDIYLDCARMDKNLIEGDGVEAILIAGRIAEKITKSIFAFEGIKDDENSQFKRIEKLNNANILPNNIKNDFSRLRRLRNDVYHNTLDSDGAGGLKSAPQVNRPYVQNGGLRDYKTGFNEVKNLRSSSNNNPDKPNSNYDNASSNKSNPFLDKGHKDISGELQAASEAHKIIFNICVWFYVNYSGDKDFIRPKYKLSRRTQEADFLIRLKSAINDGEDFLRLRQSSPNNEIIQILNELYTPKIVEEKDDNIVYGVNNNEIKIREPGIPYSQCLGISYDDTLFMWKAEHGNKELGFYQSSKEAYEAREIYISSIPMPKKVKGVYSKARGISFSKIQKLWSMSVKGQIISYHGSENEAIKARKDYLKENGLVDVKVKGGFKTITIKERDKLRAKVKEKNKKKNKSKPIKSIDSKTSIKSELNKLNESNKSSSNSSNKRNSNFQTKSNKLSYAKEFSNENKNKEKIKVKDGKKISEEKSNKKVKLNKGSRVSKNNSKKSNKSKKSQSSISPKKSSKYEGVFYEEGLFMWSAEVDGKHLGLFSSEKEAHEKREEYIKNRSSN